MSKEPEIFFIIHLFHFFKIYKNLNNINFFFSNFKVKSWSENCGLGIYQAIAIKPL